MADGRGAGGYFVPDPLSVLFERAASSALRRAYQANGRWYGTVIADPSPAQKLYAEVYGINSVLSPDTARGRKARTRWCRAFVRALERSNKRQAYPRAIEWEVGRHMPPLGEIRPRAGRAFRVRVRSGAGDSLATAAAKRKPDSERIYDDAGNPAGRHAAPELRDW